MTQTAALTTLSPPEKAKLLLTQARVEMNDRLWQAALGDSGDRHEDGARCTTPNSVGGTSFDALVAILTGEQKAPAIPDASKEAGAPAPAVVPCDEIKVETKPATVTAALPGLGANAHYRVTINAAARRTGIPAATIAAVVDAEAAKGKGGTWNLYSRNPRSSAAGLGQFLSGTWLGMARQAGTHLNETARARGLIDASGAIRPGAQGAILALRYEGDVSINAIADYARQNIASLRKAGAAIEDTAAGLAKAAYLGHHLGLGDAIRFLKGGINESRAAILLNAQIGSQKAGQRIASAGSATQAHRAWLTGFIDMKIRPDRYAL